MFNKSQHQEQQTQRVAVRSRSRSNSPANSSVDSFTRRRSKQPGSKKKSSTATNVRVFTSLPPKVEGEIKCCLRLQISRINLQKVDSTNTKKPSSNDTGNTILARCVWWGEDPSSGALFRPRTVYSSNASSSNQQLSNNNNTSNSTLQTVARYMIRSGPKQFNAYLNDMKTLDIDLLDESAKMEVLGRVQIHEIGQLSPNKPIKGYFSAYDSSQSKIGDVYVSIQIEPIQDTSETKPNENINNSVLLNDEHQLIISRSTSPSSKQLNELTANTNINNPKFDSNSYTAMTNSSSAMISSLIERGLRLKNEMLKTAAATNIRPANNNINVSYMSDEFDSNNLSSEPIIYDGYLFAASRRLGRLEDYSMNESQDAKLRELLQPSTDDLLLSKRLHNEAVKLSSDDPYQKISMNGGGNSNRVSFEMQSSDAESSCDSINGADLSSSFDVLSSQRLALLHLVQVARLRLDKMVLFPKTSVSFLIEQSSRPEHQQQWKSGQQGKPPIALKQSSLSSLSTANQDPNQLFFVEYQFPVLANSRDFNTSGPIMATQSMRVLSKRLSKRNGEDMVIFEHQSDYSVLLNPQSIESWWRSLIVFKIHARLSNSSSSSSLSSKTVQSSSLVGVARLSLRNVLKSRNLKLAKRLAVKDPNDTTKRVGTLHVSLELTSDSREFMAGLLKLKSTESSNGGVNRRRSRSPAAPIRTASPSPTPAFLPPSNLSTTNSMKQQQQLPFAHLPTFPQQQQQHQQINTIKRPTTNNNPIKPTLSTTQQQPPKQEDTNETGIPIHMYLSINESRLNHQQTSNIYLICRLFWNKEKIRFESDEKQQQKQSTNKSLCWTLNLSFVLRNSIVENMKNNFMIIEAWGRRGGEETLVGTIKLPLHEFWVKLTSKSTDERRLMVAEDSLLYQLPLIGVDGWISAFDPFTGDKAGEINALLALGSNKQIMNLQKVLFDKARSNANSGGGDFLNPLNTKPSLVEHIFTIGIENINWSRLGAGKSHSNDDQEEMYIKYTFPSSMHRSNESSTWENNRTTYIIPLKASSSQNRMEHRLVLSSTQSIHSHLIETLSSSSGVRFELWCKSVYPNRRERLLARAILPVERLLGTLTATFPVPLIDEAVSTNTTIGELNVAVSYRCEELAYNLLPPDSSKFLLPPQFTRPDDDQAAVTLNVGVLRVYGLEKAASDLIKRGASLNRLVSLENSNLYVKFALAFLNRPQEVKQTRLESSMLTGYSPEYFAYFDVKCPLQSTYNSATRRTVSLAEQIELGHLTFEVWNKFVDPNSEKNSYESLLGTCVVQLDALLDNRIGIRGWLPIRPLVGNHLLASLIDDQSSIGGLEIAIRFCKADDYLKVLDAAKQIGWTRSNEPPRSIQSVEFTSSRNIAPISPPPSQPPKQQPPTTTTTTKTESNSGDRRRVKCLVEIERAVHLASVYEAATSRHQAPNAFVSFQATASENASASASSSIETNVCARQTSPFWNYQLVVHINVDYFVDDAKYFVLKVLHSNDESRVSGDKLLGNVSIDLQPLICGLSHISGWYNIQDTAGNNQGQLKVSILPQENLVWLKDLYTKRRRQQQQSMVGASERMTSFCMAPLPPTSNNTTTNKYSDLSINQATTTSNSSLENTTSANNTSNSMSAPPATTSTPVGDLKAGLQQKLDELDRLNRSLKERLDRSKSTSINNSNNKSKSNNSESSITNRSSEEEMRIQRPPQPQQIPISYHHRHHHNEDSTPFKSSNTGGGGGGNTNHQSSVLLDSFWMSSINSDKAAAPSAVAASTAASIHINILETVKQSSGSDVNGEQNDDDDDGNEQQQELYHFNHHQPQQQEQDEEEEETNTNRVKNRATTTVTLSEPRNIFEPSESSQDSKKKITNNNEDDEKTELDQTFNLNTSFEIVEQHYERKNSEQQNDDDDEINRIIDCSKLEMNDDEEPAALNREETREVSLFIPSNVKVIKAYDNDENEEETNGRNFTVVIPEELNKIDQDESNPGDLESKLPNYFLPRDDMEKSMKRLHFNYKTIDKIKKLDEENGNEEENDDDEEDTKQHSVKHKSVALLIQNQNVLKQDLNRINKIFHSKFS